ncbi:uncharacterized protein LOC128246979 [Octopus bimaculoides]|uniref:uncharacterized protein LOC128246979 n=1 Tax=Octopus bimaculoides TaxID=37653 RepID=UPI00071D01BC|nr:uncharacterized protein LOC128246979 [Octopus bimaculoides]|eukprot:XP_014769181.1 PREDICTED: uncharacterized protein LOC106868433 [Octopus bimaculoides]
MLACKVHCCTAARHGLSAKKTCEEKKATKQHVSLTIYPLNNCLFYTISSSLHLFCSLCHTNQTERRGWTKRQAPNKLAHHSSLAIQIMRFLLISPNQLKYSQIIKEKILVLVWIFSGSEHY